MSSNKNTPNQAVRPPLPYYSQRFNTTPTQRPSTSAGEAIEPISDFLAAALREKKGLLPRSQSTTPRRARTGLRSQAYQATLDEWMPSSDEERRSARRNGARPHRTRRASDFTIMKSSPAASLSSKDANSAMDRLQKENWDLKHRVALQQDRVKKLNEQLEQAIEEMDNAKELRARNEELSEAIIILSKRLASSEEEMKELTDINDDLVKELELRDSGIKERQLAIEEAAGIIQSMEIKMEILQNSSQLLEPSLRQDSDYFSGDAEGPPPKRAVTPKPLTLTVNAPDSDYFSADTSANNTPKTPRKMHIAAPKEKLERARETGASYNKEMGLRTAASRDSLFSTFLGAPNLPAPQKQHPRTLRRKSPVPGLQTMQQRSVPEPIVEEVARSTTPSWSHSRPLRSLYEQGEFKRQIHSKTPIFRVDSQPSVTVASAFASTDDLLNPANRSGSPSTAVSDSAVPTPSSKPSDVSPEISLPSNPSPLNYSSWPRKYPEWPPSASLTNRDVLFHGDGVDDMFPTSPQEDHRHLRVASADPSSGDLPTRPPPLLRSGTTTTPPSSRPAGLDRRRTLR
jgi:hypothetical protein